jgi:hypothetical protein
MKYEEALVELKRAEVGKAFITRKMGRLNGVKLFLQEGGTVVAKRLGFLPWDLTIDVDFSLTTSDLNANDWFFDIYDSSSFSPTQEYGPDTIKRNPDNDKYLTAPAYAGRFAGEGRKYKYVYLDMSRIEHLPEHVDEGDLIERGWMKAEPDFQGVAYCRFCGASLIEERYGYLTSTCPKCKQYCGYADFQMCVSC